MSSESRGKRRSQVERRNESEEALLDAAEELFAECGVANTSVQKISHRAGYSRGIVNVHFGSKEAFIERLVQRSQERFYERIDDLKQAAGTGAVPALEKILTIINMYVDSVQSNVKSARTFLVLWGASFSEQSPIKGFPDADAHARETLADLIRQGQADGSINPQINPKDASLFILGMIRGAVAQLLVAGDNMEVNLKELHQQSRIFVSSALSVKP